VIGRVLLERGAWRGWTKHLNWGLNAWVHDERRTEFLSTLPEAFWGATGSNITVSSLPPVKRLRAHFLPTQPLSVEASSAAAVAT
jgi:hypothetical protein